MGDELQVGKSKTTSIIVFFSVAILGTLLIRATWQPIGDLSRGLSQTLSSIPWQANQVRVTILASIVLSIAGGMGGLACHIGRAGIVFPYYNREQGKPTTLILGFIGDAFLGVVAANALHFPLSSMVAYKNLVNPTDASQAWLALAALGILGGYAGNILLKRWSDSLVARLAKDIEEGKELLKQTKHETEAIRQRDDKILLAALENAATTEKPLDITAEQMLKSRREEVEATKMRDGIKAITPIDGLIAAQSLFDDGKHSQALELLEHALANKLDFKLAATAENLAGLCHHYVMDAGWFEKASNCYTRATQLKPGVLLEAVVTTNFGFMLLDHGNIDDAITKFSAIRSAHKDLGVRSKIIDAALIGLAACNAKKALAGSTDLMNESLKILKEIRFPEQVRFLILDGSISSDVVDAWKKDSNVPPALIPH